MNVNPMRSKTGRTFFKNHDLVLYFVLAYVITWLIFLPLVIISIQQQEKLSIHSIDNFVLSLVHDFGSLGPAIASLIIILMLYKNKGIKIITEKLKFWSKPRWVNLAIFSPFILFIISIGTALTIFKTTINFTDFLQSKEILGFSWLFTILLPSLSYGIFEEIGWRGYALPRLQTRYPAIIAALILGFFWALWHLPAFIYHPNFPFEQLPFYIIGICCGSIWLTWIYNTTEGSLLAVMIWHVTWDIVNIIGLLIHQEAVYIMNALVMIWPVFIVVLWGFDNLSPKSRQSLNLE